MPHFATTARFAAAGCLLKPVIYEFFQQDRDFALTVRFSSVAHRRPDGWFHPSAHPVMSERELWAYLALPHAPGRREEMGYVSSMSVKFGSITGELLKAALLESGIALQVPVGTCPACGLVQPGRCPEHGVIDEATRSRGHMDDIADFGTEGTFGVDWKTIRPWALRDAPDMDPGYFRATWPRYWGQAQEYMRMSGLRRFIVFFLGLGNPWEMREYHLEYDPVFCFETEQKYKRVLAAVAGNKVIR